MTYLNTPEMREAYKREVAVPGEFATQYPNTTDTDIDGMVSDGFAEAQLNGWFSGYVLEPLSKLVTPDLAMSELALVLVYAGIRNLRNEIRTQQTVIRYKAGPVEYENQWGASVLTALLKDAQARLQRLEEIAASAGTSSYVLDGYVNRVLAYDFWYAVAPGSYVGI